MMKMKIKKFPLFWHEANFMLHVNNCSYWSTEKPRYISEGHTQYPMKVRFVRYTWPNDLLYLMEIEHYKCYYSACNKKYYLPTTITLVLVSQYWTVVVRNFPIQNIPN